MPQCSNQLLTTDAGTVRLEEHEVGLGLLNLDSRDLGQAARQRARVGVIVRKAFHVVVESVEASCCADAGLSHRSAQALFPLPGRIDEVAGAGEHAADRCAKPL